MPRTSRRVVLTTLALALSVLGVVPAVPASAAPSPRPQAGVPGRMVPLLRSAAPIRRAPGTFTGRDGLRRAIVAGSPATPRSSWQVTYTGFTAQQRAAFQAAVDIWAGIVSSPIPIKVDASLSSTLGPGVLGFAGPDNFYTVPSAGDHQSMYPSALADALTNSDLSPSTPDIVAEFSSTEPGIYYGTDGLPPANNIDFESVVLHELGHGLGFSGTATVTGGQGSYYSPHAVFDVFNADAAGAGLLALPNNSTALGTALTNNAVYWNGASGKSANGGTAPRLYAPTTWSDGSSIAHLDEATYPAGDPNSLMTPFLQDQEVIHSPGVITVGMFKDSGWNAVLAAPDAPTGVTAQPLESSVNVSWTAPAPNGSPVSGYTVLVNDGTTTTSVASPGTGTSTTVTGLTNGTPYTFSVTATNALGTSPASSPSSAVAPARDTTPPTVALTAGPGAFTQRTGTVSFAGSDPGHPSAALTYSCTLDGTAGPCTSPFTFSGLADGSHTFSVTATDASSNTGTPAGRTWTVDATAPTVSTQALPPFSLASTVGLRVAGADGGSGVASYDVRYRRAAFNSGFTALTSPAGWQGTTATAVSLSAGKGYTYCLSARSRDKAGNTSAWSAERCTSVALDDRALGASAGWGRSTSAAYYGGTVTSTSRKGVTLTRTGVQTRRLALVATTCRGCGTVGVYWNGRLVRTLSLNSSATSHRRVLTIADFGGVRSGTLTIRTLNTGRTFVDGLALSRA